MSPAPARRLNVVFVLAMCAMLLGAYGVQFILRELPCPLALILAIANALTVLLMCGLSECPDKPVSYLSLPASLGRP